MSWSRLDRRLHWIMAVLFVWQFASRWISSALPDDHGAVFHLNGLHSVGGYTIFGLGVWRVANRMRNRRPPLPGSPPMQRLAAQLTHAILYIMMFVQPVTGMLVSGEQFGGPPYAMQYLHNAGGWLILGLIAIHAAAAAWHHAVVKDGTLTRMLR
jgi:cytochrome b561